MANPKTIELDIPTDAAERVRKQDEWSEGKFRRYEDALKEIAALPVSVNFGLAAEAKMIARQALKHE